MPRTAATSGPAMAAPIAPRPARTRQERLPRRCQTMLISASGNVRPSTRTAVEVTCTDLSS